MPDPATPLASVVITSRNRKDDLLTAIDSCLNQSVPLEVLVFDDASTDGTSAAIHARFPPAQFPQVRTSSSDKPVGYIVLRNRGARLARSNFIFSIDDDAIFTSKTIVESTLNHFSHPRVGAIAIPFKNIRISDEFLQHAPNNSDLFAASDFIGTSHALRRDLFLHLGGYRECFIHQGEESDYCIRLLNAGYIVRLGSSDPVHHFVSPKRDMTRLHFYGSRNNILFVWFNVDLLRAPFYLTATTLKTLLHAIRVRALGTKIKAVFCGCLDGLRNFRERRPVSPATFRLFRQLRAPAKLSDIEPRLPPPITLPTPPASPS